MILVSRNMQLVQIFTGVLKIGAPNVTGVVKNGDSFEISDSKAHILYSNMQFLVGFQWSQNAWPWMSSKCDSKCFVLDLVPDLSMSTRLLCLVFTNVPLLTYCKIRYIYQNLQWHRGVVPETQKTLHGTSVYSHNLWLKIDHCHCCLDIFAKIKHFVSNYLNYVWHEQECTCQVHDIIVAFHIWYTGKRWRLLWPCVTSVWLCIYWKQHYQWVCE